VRGLVAYCGGDDSEQERHLRSFRVSGVGLVDSELTSLAGEISPYTTAAVEAYGGAVLVTVRDQPAGATAGLGRRMLQRIFGTSAVGEAPEPVADLAADPSNPDLQAALRVVIIKKLAADPALADDLRGMLAGAPVVAMAASGGPAASSDRPPGGEQVRAERVREPVWARFHKWSLDHKLAFAGIVLSFIAVIVGPVIPVLLAGGGNGGSGSTTQNQFRIKNPEGGQFDAGGNIINNNNTTSGSALSSDPQARIVQLTGQFTTQGFVNAVFGRETSIVALYLETGMVNAATLYEGTSAILFGFEGFDQNGDPDQSGDPVALIKTFQAAGFKVNDELDDSYLMGELTGNDFPLQFHTDLAPAGYTGGYQDGTFVGSLLFWIVQRALGTGLADQDLQVIDYLISQGADCKVPLSFMNYNGSLLSGLSAYNYKVLLPIMQSCAG
jgi:hypothetical protein